jgi:hypothetical protein
MTLQFELSPEMEARLVAGARERGISVEKYAETLLRDAVVIRSTADGRLSVEQLHAMLDAIAEGSEKLPNLPTSAFSRESLYEGRAE